MMGAFPVAGSQRARIVMPCLRISSAFRHGGKGEAYSIYAHNEHHVEAANLVGNEARDCPAKEGGCVEDGDEILCQFVAHAPMHAFEDDIVDWQEQAHKKPVTTISYDSRKDDSIARMPTEMHQT